MDESKVLAKVLRKHPRVVGSGTRRIASRAFVRAGRARADRFERTQSRRGHIRTMIADRDHVVFDYVDSENSANVAELFEGYRGYVRADAASVYDVLFRSEGASDPPCIEVACWSHLRRYFCEATVGERSDLANEALYRERRIFQTVRPDSSRGTYIVTSRASPAFDAAIGARRDALSNRKSARSSRSVSRARAEVPSVIASTRGHPPVRTVLPRRRKEHHHESHDSPTATAPPETCPGFRKRSGPTSVACASRSL